MKNEVYTTPYFDNRYKRLAKKFDSLESNVEHLIEQLLENPKLGEPLGAGLYKIRLAVTSKGKVKVADFGWLLIFLKKRRKVALFIWLPFTISQRKVQSQKKN